jgi:hypothetical protein
MGFDGLGGLDSLSSSPSMTLDSSNLTSDSGFYLNSESFDVGDVHVPATYSTCSNSVNSATAGSEAGQSQGILGSAWESVTGNKWTSSGQPLQDLLDNLKGTFTGTATIQPGTSGVNTNYTANDFSNGDHMNAMQDYRNATDTSGTAGPVERLINGIGNKLSNLRPSNQLKNWADNQVNNGA